MFGNVGERFLLIAGHFQRDVKTFFIPSFSIASASFRCARRPGKHSEPFCTRVRDVRINIGNDDMSAPVRKSAGYERIGLAPVTSTSSPTRSNESAGTALPSDRNRKERQRNHGSACQQFDCGMPTNRPTRRDDSRQRPVYSDKDTSPGRQFRQCPQVIWPSPTTRSPREKAFYVIANKIDNADKLRPMVIGNRTFLGPGVPVVDARRSRRWRSSDANEQCHRSQPLEPALPRATALARP